MYPYQIVDLVQTANAGNSEALETILDVLAAHREFMTTCALALEACELTAAGVGVDGLKAIRATAETAAQADDTTPAARRALRLLAVTIRETLDAAAHEQAEV